MHGWCTVKSQTPRRDRHSLCSIPMQLTRFRSWYLRILPLVLSAMFWVWLLLCSTLNTYLFSITMQRDPHADAHEALPQGSCLLMSCLCLTCKENGVFHLCHDCLWMIKRGKAFRDMLIVFSISTALTVRPSLYLNPVYPSEAETASSLIVNLLIVRWPWASK